MGTINYKRSNYITLGIKPYDPDDWKNNQDFLDFIRDEWNVSTEDENAVYSAISEEINNNYSDDYENAKAILDQYQFYFFNVTIEPGYYEGFSITIENNSNCVFDDYSAKKEAQKEITLLKACLVDLANIGLVSCGPGWCTGYRDHTGTINDIKIAIKEMRNEVKETPTWAQYERACG